MATGYADVPVSGGDAKTAYYDTLDGSMVHGVQYVEDV